MKQDWFRQAGEDFWHLDRDDFCNHFGKADLRGQGPSLDKEVKGELVQLPNNLGEGEKRERKRGERRDKNKQNDNMEKNEGIEKFTKNEMCVSLFPCAACIVLLSDLMF